MKWKKPQGLYCSTSWRMDGGGVGHVVACETNRFSFGLIAPLKDIISPFENRGGAREHRRVRTDRTRQRAQAGRKAQTGRSARANRRARSALADSSAALRQRHLIFLAKAAVVLGDLFLLSRTAPIMPAPLLALCWAALSGLLAAAAYHHTIRKTHKQTMCKAGGVLGRINSGRLLTLLVGFVISAFCVGCLIVESPKWDAYEWFVVVLAPFLYLLALRATGKFVKAELKEAYQRSRARRYSAAFSLPFCSASPTPASTRCCPCWNTRASKRP